MKLPWKKSSDRWVSRTCQVGTRETHPKLYLLLAARLGSTLSLMKTFQIRIKKSLPSLRDWKCKQTMPEHTGSYNSASQCLQPTLNDQDLVNNHQVPLIFAPASISGPTREPNRLLKAIMWNALFLASPCPALPDQQHPIRAYVRPSHWPQNLPPFFKS